MLSVLLACIGILVPEGVSCRYLVILKVEAKSIVGNLKSSEGVLQPLVNRMYCSKFRNSSPNTRGNHRM